MIKIILCVYDKDHMSELHQVSSHVVEKVKIVHPGSNDKKLY